MVQPNKVDPNQRPFKFTNVDNTSDARQAFEERKKYAEFIFPISSDVGRSFNFWGSDKFFGRVNQAGDSILVSERRLKQLGASESGKTCYALDFVADAWRDFSDKIKSEVASGRLYDSGPYSKLEVQRGWSDIYTDYHSYMTGDLYPAFQNVFMNLPMRKRKIANFDGFLEIFDEFSDLIIKDAGPITLSGFVESIYSSPLNTGLVIETSRAEHDEDLNKEVNFLYDENYGLVVSLASQYGFYVDKNAPWRFVCDPASRAAQEYMIGIPMTNPDPVDNPEGDCEDSAFVPKGSRLSEPFGYSRIPGFENVLRHAPGYEPYRDEVSAAFGAQAIYSGLFRASYLETWNSDIDILKVYLLDFYNRYVAANSSLLIPAETLKKCDKPITIFREILTPNVLSLYGDKWSLRAFYSLRRRERSIKETPKNELRDIREIFTFYDFSPQGRDNSRYVKALKYTFDKFVGGLTTNMISAKLIS
jgi:hypothetical protein|tara:strand:- start:2460 stop:3884 length:1425 start_codon:yes stop_codon:yes gene_type:complete